MHDVDKSKLLKRYAERIDEVGHGAAALGEPKERQAFYFDILSQVDGLEPSDSVVDVGCGYGDLFSYLRSTGWRGVYQGIDINPQLIEEGRRRYPDADLRVVDIEDKPPKESTDWCICCQALTSATETVPFIEHFESMLRIMWNTARKGVVFNVLSPLADYTHPVHARPPLASVLDVVVKLTNRFVLRHDYMPYEFAIYAYKDNRIDPATHIFSAHQVRFENVAAHWRKHRS